MSSPEWEATRSKVEAMLRKEKEKAFVASVYLELKPPLGWDNSQILSCKVYRAKVLAVWCRKGNIKEHVIHFIGSMGPFSYDIGLP